MFLFLLFDLLDDLPDPPLSSLDQGQGNEGVGGINQGTMSVNLVTDQTLFSHKIPNTHPFILSSGQKLHKLT